jgi:hypothetical protein
MRIGGIGALEYAVIIGFQSTSNPVTHYITHNPNTKLTP